MGIIASAIVANGVWKWILRLGAPGLIVVGLIDNSVIPIPGGMDAFVILLAAAGILQYSPRKFLTALGIGRGIRFFAVAFLGRVYGTAIVGWLGRYYRPFLYVLIAVGIAAGTAAIIYFKRRKLKRLRAATVR